MNIYETKENVVVKESVRVLIGRKCDICGKEILPNNVYYLTTTGHYEWGNDSIDSIDYKHVCSVDCLQNVIKEYQETDYDSQYLNIEKEINRLGDKE